MARQTARDALVKARAWWPELLCTALLTAIALAGQKDDPLFAVFCAIIGAIFWAMGWRHHRLPLHEKVDRISAGVTEVLSEVRAQRDPVQDEDGRPQLRVVRND